MRPGLVVVGATLLLLGGLVVAAEFQTSPTEPAATSHVITFVLPADTRSAILLWAVNGSASAFAVDWRAGASVAVNLSPTSGCSSPVFACSSGAPVANWPGNVSGVWSGPVASGSEWLLRFGNPGTSALTVRVTYSSTPPPANAPPTWAVLVGFAAAIALGIVGALALFLGLFLRGGVFPGRGEAPPRGPDEREPPDY